MSSVDEPSVEQWVPEVTLSLRLDANGQLRTTIIKTMVGMTNGIEVSRGETQRYLDGEFDDQLSSVLETIING